MRLDQLQVLNERAREIATFTSWALSLATEKDLIGQIASFGSVPSEDKILCNVFNDFGLFGEQLQCELNTSPRGG
jgi:hypothetical protein